MNFTQEQLTKARQAKSAEELLTYAKEISYPLTEEEAKHYFEQWHKEGALADDELENVSGAGCDGDEDSKNYKCPDCGGELKLTPMRIGGSYWFFYKCSNCGAEYEKTVTGFGNKVH